MENQDVEILMIGQRQRLSLPKKSYYAARVDVGIAFSM